MGGLAPSYSLYFEINESTKTQVMFAKKTAFKGRAYYELSMGNSSLTSTRESIGKLKAVNNEDNTFTLYDCGKNYSKKGLSFH